MPGEQGTTRPTPAAVQATPTGPARAERPVLPPRARRPEPVQEFYSIGEVCALTDLKPHVLRYWETQFRILSPAKNRSGNRVYARREVELVLLVKQLLYTEKYTLEGARLKLDALRKGGDLRALARTALARETALAVERDLRDILDLLEGRRPSAPGAGQGGDGAALPASGAADGHGTAH
jgi:DNA-binding transcriptional MerR regulator